MSDTPPPDGHWHRRTAKPIRDNEDGKTYGCTHTGCVWTTTETPLRSGSQRYVK